MSLGITIVFQNMRHIVHIMYFAYKHTKEDNSNRFTSLLRGKENTKSSAKLVPFIDHQRNKRAIKVITKDFEYQ